MNKIWRAKGWSEAKIQREALCRHVSKLLDIPVGAAVRGLLERRGGQLLDLTFSEAFEAFFELRCQELRLARKLSSEFGRKDWKIRLATKGIRKVLRRGYKAYEEWLREGRRGLAGGVRKVYLRDVAGYWRNEPLMRRNTTEQGRHEAKRLQKKLDDNPEVVQLRRRLRIPDGGFRDVEEAACWVYDRWPPLRKRYDLRPGEPPGAYTLPVPPVIRVASLGEAARHLRKEHELNGKWEFMLRIYLLRGKLEPLPRLREPRERPKAERNAYLLDLMERHSYRRTQIIYNYGLSEEDFLGIVEAHPGATDGELEVLCGELAEEKGCWREDYVTYDNLRQIKSRWRGSLMGL
jgi:hypothetical protein